MKNFTKVATLTASGGLKKNIQPTCCTHQNLRMTFTNILAGTSKNDYIVLNGTVRFMILRMFLGEMVSKHLVSCRNDFYPIVYFLCGKISFRLGSTDVFFHKTFRNVYCHLLTIRTSGNFAPTHSSNALLR